MNCKLSAYRYLNGKWDLTAKIQVIEVKLGKPLMLKKTAAEIFEDEETKTIDQYLKNKEIGELRQIIADKSNQIQLCQKIISKLGENNDIKFQNALKNMKNKCQTSINESNNKLQKQIKVNALILKENEHLRSRNLLQHIIDILRGGYI